MTPNKQKIRVSVKSSKRFLHSHLRCSSLFLWLTQLLTSVWRKARATMGSEDFSRNCVFLISVTRTRSRSVSCWRCRSCSPCPPGSRRTWSGGRPPSLPLVEQLLGVSAYLGSRLCLRYPMSASPLLFTSYSVITIFVCILISHWKCKIRNNWLHAYIQCSFPPSNHVESLSLANSRIRCCLLRTAHEQ